MRRGTTIVTVSARPEHAALLQMLVADVSAYDVVQVAPIDVAYSLIREVAPDLIVVVLSIDDLNACQLLSMLAIDTLTRHIPILSCTLDPQGADDEVFLGAFTDDSTCCVPIELN
jgi:DNA-binding response OmpR family regulator